MKEKGRKMKRKKENRKDMKMKRAKEKERERGGTSLITGMPAVWSGAV